MFIDDCVQGIQKIMDSDCEQPLNLGSDEMIDMNDFAKLALSFEAKNLPIKHIPGPEGVRGRNSDNQMIKEKLGWAPSIPVAEGLKKTYFWIKAQVEKDKAAGIDITKLGTSEIVVQTTDDLDELAAQGVGGPAAGVAPLVLDVDDEAVELHERRVERGGGRVDGVADGGVLELALPPSKGGDVPRAVWAVGVVRLR